MLKSLSDCVELALTLEDDSSEYEVNFQITIEGETWNCYTASITHRDILLYSDKGTATYFVDSYGDRNLCELFDYERE